MLARRAVLPEAAIIGPSTFTQSVRPTSNLQPLTSAVRSYLQTTQNLPFVFNRLRTLLFYVGLKSFICRSYENCRGVPTFFPFWNSVFASRRSRTTQAARGNGATRGLGQLQYCTGQDSGACANSGGSGGEGADEASRARSLRTAAAAGKAPGRETGLDAGCAASGAILEEVRILAPGGLRPFGRLGQTAS